MILTCPNPMCELEEKEEFFETVYSNNNEIVYCPQCYYQFNKADGIELSKEYYEHLEKWRKWAEKEHKKKQKKRTKNNRLMMT